MMRVILTAITVALWSWVNFFVRTAEPLITGPAAARQFDNSDMGYMRFHTIMHAYPMWFTATTIIGVLVLVLIWLKPLRALFLAIIGVSVLFSSPSALAYYSKSDYTEVYFIGPNQSAFYIPDVGANKDTQAAFGSEEYYRENKIAAKRFQIPHQQLSGSGFTEWSDYYVPAGRLIIVDRSPFAKEWVDAPERGTSVRKEGFPCQSKEGLNVAVGMSIGASVSEEDSPRFLYNFGVKNPGGDPTNPEVIFRSVFYGYSLGDVMDTVVRRKVQTLVCNEISRRPFDQVNAESAVIETAIEKKVGAFLSSVGITLRFLGWADTFTFDAAVQQAVNDRYIADKLGPVMPILERLAEVKVKEGFGKGLADHGLPSNLIALPANWMSVMSSLMGPGAVPAAPAAAAALDTPLHH